MVVDTRRPPLPAPTEDPSPMDNESNLGTDLATDVSRRTDMTHYSVPEDGSPITIATHKLSSADGRLHHGRQKSSTSLLIEYFEAAKSGDKSRNRPSVRVKVTPSAGRKSRIGNEAIQFTAIGKDRKPSYVRRISLGNKIETFGPTEGTEVSHSSESTGKPPVEIEFMDPNGSDLSGSRGPGGSLNASDISSMPPDSLLHIDTAAATMTDTSKDQRDRSIEPETLILADHLKAPSRERSRSLSKERITQKVMEKIAADRDFGGRRRSSRDAVEYEPETKPSKDKRRRSSRTYREGDVVSPESSLLSSNLASSQVSHPSAGSKVSLNNPRLLEMVQDTVRKLILPEITQMRTENMRARNLRDFEDSQRTSSSIDRESHGDDLGRRLSKSSSTPQLPSKPKVVLNRHGDDPGEVLSRGDSERVKVRRTSRDSEGKHRDRRTSKTGSIEDESAGTPKSKDGQRLRDAAAGGVAAGVLTAAALRTHDSHDRERRKTRSKSGGSRSTDKTHRQEEVPPMPFSGGVNDSELTRTSILSAATEHPRPTLSRAVMTPIREVSRGSLGDVASLSSLTPSRTPVTARHLGSSQSKRSLDEVDPQTDQSISARARMAALIAAGLGGAAVEPGLQETHDAPVDTYGSPKSHRAPSLSTSPREELVDPLIPLALRTHNSASPVPTKQPYRSDELNEGLYDNGQATSPLGVQYEPSTPESQQRSLGLRDHKSNNSGRRRTQEVEDWFHGQHEVNERYRDSRAESYAQDSYDGKRMTQYTDDSFNDSMNNSDGAVKDVQELGANPQIVHTPHAVESAVASLLDPSLISSIPSSKESSTRLGTTKRHHSSSGQVRDISDVYPAAHELEMARGKKTSSSGSRWSALRDQAQALSAQTSKGQPSGHSPRYTEGSSLEDKLSFKDASPIHMGSSGVPLADDPMPEIGHGVDDASDITTNPSDIQGHSTPESRRKHFSYEDAGLPANSERHEHTHASQHRDEADEIGLVSAGAGLSGGPAAVHAVHVRDKSTSQASVPRLDDDYSDERGLTPDLHDAHAVYVNKKTTGRTSPLQLGDEGYASAARARSPRDITSKAALGRHANLRGSDQAAYEAAMGADDRLPGKTHSRHLSANSHGMASPLYDSATGRGIDRIQSQDVVALMDHLTVRDAQRNARDTEILVTLVRSAAEMRSEFEEMKRFIETQDQMIMKHSDRDTDEVLQKVLGGPRPQQTAGNHRTPRTSYEEEEPAKRKNVFRRALNGLSMRSTKDLARIEDMLMQLLDDVEVLKDSQGASKPSTLRNQRDSLDSYEKVRASHDMGHETDGHVGASSSAKQSSNTSIAQAHGKDGFHSGYDGRRGSANRVSTVLEGDEDTHSYLEPHEAEVLDHQFENNEQMTTPTQETMRRDAGLASTPPGYNVAFDKSADASPEDQRKHKSNSSSMFRAIPKFSRWSKTTASSVPERGHDLSHEKTQDSKVFSQASRSGESVGRGRYYDDGYFLKSDDRLRSTQSLARDAEGAERAAPIDTRSMLSSQVTRTPSPLIPEGGSSVHRMPVDNQSVALLKSQLPEEDDDYLSDDPKYQAHHNSLLLEHPQPRPGPTHRHQTYLESQAQTYGPARDGISDLGTGSDLSQRTTSDADFDPLQWGSNPALSLARTNKLGGIGPGSPLQSPIDSAAVSPRRGKDSGPLVPQTTAKPEPSHQQDRAAPQQQYSRMDYASPLGAGHLLEPIEEVRYSLETDRSRTPERAPPASSQRSPTDRKITGPRPMSNSNPRSPRVKENTPGAVRRKPVARSIESLDSETF